MIVATALDQNVESMGLNMQMNDLKNFQGIEDITPENLLNI
jgi:hypothetical protein